jgi:hypothetical protein
VRSRGGLARHFGNSNGDQEMLGYIGAGDGARLTMLVLHDDAQREYASGPAQELPETKVGTFSQEPYDEKAAFLMRRRRSLKGSVQVGVVHRV